ncbi:hypothetical protein [Aquamicrobium terrae]|uniref:Uncharacterized protein n=1 Tax=Aquamicrobium terrae TaxID=1324945 RepID=A0ABV2MVX3_9HYPH
MRDDASAGRRRAAMRSIHQRNKPAAFALLPQDDRQKWEIARLSCQYPGIAAAVPGRCCSDSDYVR